MKLQLSLDMVDLDEAFADIEATKDSVDIIEVGTPFALRCGVQAITSIKERYPDKEVLADYKIMDGGDYEASMAFVAGADIVTVLGVANDATLSGAVSAAKRCRGKIMVDLMGMNELAKRISPIEKLEVDYLCIHTAIDGRNSLRGAFSDLMLAKQTVTTAKLAIAGGLNIHNIAQAVHYRPDVVIVGAGITAEADKTQAAAGIKQKLREAENG